MRVCTNPYTGQLIDLDAVPEGAGGVKVCPTTHQPLNHAAVDAFSYSGPEQDRATWAAEAHARVDALEAQAAESNAKTLGIPVAKAGK